MSIEQQNQIRDLQERVSLLEAAVQALLAVANAPALPNVPPAAPKPTRFASILSRRKTSG